jgi:uncharacterized membrane protein
MLSGRGCFERYLQPRDRDQLLPSAAPMSNDTSDKRFETLLGTLLRAGVVLASAVVLAGGVLYLVQHRGPAPQYGIFHGEPSDVHYAIDVLRDAFSGHGRGLIQLGLLLLIATPIARVALSVIEFAIKRDWLYVVTTLIVLGVLIYSLGSR